MKYIGIDLGGTGIKAGVRRRKGQYPLQGRLPHGRGARLRGGHPRHGRPVRSGRPEGRHVHGRHRRHRHRPSGHLRSGHGAGALLHEPALASGAGDGRDAQVSRQAGLHRQRRHRRRDWPNLSRACPPAQRSASSSPSAPASAAASSSTASPTPAPHGVASEIGHMITVVGGELCTCGNRGCWERYASATAIIREGRKFAQAHPDCAIAKAVGGDLDAINGQDRDRPGQGRRSRRGQTVRRLRHSPLRRPGQPDQPLRPRRSSPSAAASPIRDSSCSTPSTKSFRRWCSTRPCPTRRSSWRSWATTPASSARPCSAASEAHILQ